MSGCSSHLNADEATWCWVREDAAGPLYLESGTAVQKRHNGFLTALADRKDQVGSRCRTVSESKAQRLARPTQPDYGHPPISHPTLALV